VLSRDAELWWVGPSGWLFQPNGSGQDTSAAGRKVYHLGWVTDRRLCQLYRQAAFTIYPSLYEGFGLPVLEALLHGTPVLSSLNSSLQEFAGPGVSYFDACDPVSLDDACRELRGSLPHRLERQDLRERCSWDNLARTVVALCA
jgi:glycosyltransferase involved in cell wall biosynthesis